MTTPKAQSTSKASYRVTARDGSGEHLTVGPFTTTEAAEHLATTLATVGIYRTIEITTE